MRNLIHDTITVISDGEQPSPPGVGIAATASSVMSIAAAASSSSRGIAEVARRNSYSLGSRRLAVESI